jgi:NAD-dependent deacetylase
LAAQPNVAHAAIARLESKFNVVVITQNIDDLHERAGSSNVIHIHGEILKARSSVDPSLISVLNKATIDMGELCEKGSQLRPDVVWFGEDVRSMEECLEHFTTASRIIIVGTSLTVYPAASLVKKSPFSAEKYLVSPEAQKVPYGFRFLKGLATTVVPHVVNCWLEGRKPM